tara:strand:+ start:136 stop:396 length:261 start_codon:yes stop_codon:yes gene_type:complete
MKIIGTVVDSIFGQNGLPDSIRIVKDLGVGTPEGSVFNYDSGFWYGEGDFAIMGFKVKNLLDRGEAVKNEIGNSGWDHRHVNKICV